MDDIPARSARIEVRKIQPRLNRMDVAIERKGVTRRVPGLVVIFPPMLNPQPFQQYLIKTAPRLFTASSGVSRTGRRYAHEPAASYYLREAFHRALTDVTAAQLPRAISILPILMAGCAARGEQLVARYKVTRDSLVPIHARAFDLMMSVDTEALHQRVRDAEAEQIDARTNWNYQDPELLSASDQNRRRRDRQVYTERDEFIRMARTLLGEGSSGANATAPNSSVSALRMAAMGERCHERAWVDREMPDTDAESLPPARVEVMLGSSEIDASILSEFDTTYDADGESQLMCAYDSMRQVETASMHSILESDETVYLMVSVAPRFYEVEFSRVLQQFASAIPADAGAELSAAIGEAFTLVMQRATRMMAIHNRYVQSFIENPQGRRIVVFNTDEFTPFIDLVGIPAYDPVSRDMSPPERQLTRYYPLLMNACSEQLLESFRGDRSALTEIRIPHVFVNEDTMTRVQVARMSGSLTTLINATYAPQSEMSSLDPMVLMQLRTAEGDTGRLPVPIVAPHKRGAALAAVQSPDAGSDDESDKRRDYEELEDRESGYGALLLVESRSGTPPFVRANDTEEVQSNDYSVLSSASAITSTSSRTIRATSMVDLPSSETFYHRMPATSAEV